MTDSKEMGKPKNRIAEVRKKRGLTQFQLAHDSHLSNQVISMYERGKRSPKAENWRALANALDVPISYLKGEEDSVTSAFLNANDVITAIKNAKGKINDNDVVLATVVNEFLPIITDLIKSFEDPEMLKQLKSIPTEEIPYFAYYTFRDVQNLIKVELKDFHKDKQAHSKIIKARLALWGLDESELNHRK